MKKKRFRAGLASQQLRPLPPAAAVAAQAPAEVAQQATLAAAEITAAATAAAVAQPAAVATLTPAPIFFFCGSRRGTGKKRPKS